MGGIEHGSAEGCFLIAEIAGDLQQVDAQLREEAKEDGGAEKLDDSSGKDEQCTRAGGFDGSREGGGDEKGHDALLPYPAVSGFARGEHAISKAPQRGHEDQQIILVADEHSEKGSEGHAERNEDHGQQAGVVNTLFGAEAGGHSAARGKQSRAG